MRRAIAPTSFLATIALLACSSWLPANRLASGQGKGGEVIAKPTPTPKKATTTKKTPPARTTGNSKTSRPAKSATAAEMIFWNSIKDSTNPDDFKEYLKKYPNGEFAGLARNRLNAMELAAKEAASKEEAARKEEAKRKEDEAAKKRPGAVVKNSIGMELVYVPAGSFMMGSENESLYEAPIHRVTIGNGFYMGRYEVTQAQWQQVMGNNPSGFKGCDRCPVEGVSWEHAREFIQRLNARGDGYTYRLPTEAEWEYACRAGTTTKFAFGDSLSSEQANFDGDSPYPPGASKGVYRRKTMPVGSFQPNAWGLYDMHGNVSEWCEDWFHDNYNGAPTDGSAWLSRGEHKYLSEGGPKYRVVRGGGYFSSGLFVTSSNRNTLAATDTTCCVLGFRVVTVVRTQ